MHQPKHFDLLIRKRRLRKKDLSLKMSGSNVARKVLSKASRHPLIQRSARGALGNPSNTRLLPKQAKLSAPKRLFSSTSSPSIKPPQSINNEGSIPGGSTLLKEGAEKLEGAIPNRMEAPTKYYCHRGGRRPFFFGRFVALGAFGFIGYRAMVGPPLLLSDEEISDERRWR